MKALVAILILAALPAVADTVVPVRTIRAREIIGPADIRVAPETVAGAVGDPARVIGREARTTLYAGRPIMAGHTAEPALVGRNEVVPLVFLRGGLRIVTEGRALGRGAEGEILRVMNLTSRTTVFGRVTADGSIEVE